MMVHLSALVLRLVHSMVPMTVCCLAQTLLVLRSVHRYLLHLLVQMCLENQTAHL